MLSKIDIINLQGCKNSNTSIQSDDKELEQPIDWEEQANVEEKDIGLILYKLYGNSIIITDELTRKDIYEIGFNFYIKINSMVC